MTFIIAEAGINHCGSFDRALRMIDAAVDAGCDAVKFQSFTAGRLGYEPELTEFLKSCEMSKIQTTALFEYAKAAHIEFISTPFDLEWAEFLKHLGVQRLKISSGKVSDRAFMSGVRALGLPLIISNGMADPETFRDVTQPRDTILYCVSQYPTPLHKIDLRQMSRLRNSYFKVGFSDHTQGIAASVLAAAAGAEVIETHFTLDRTLPGPDQICSKEPSELAEMVKEIRCVA